MTTSRPDQLKGMRVLVNMVGMPAKGVFKEK